MTCSGKFSCRIVHLKWLEAECAAVSVGAANWGWDWSPTWRLQHIQDAPLLGWEPCITVSDEHFFSHWITPFHSFLCSVLGDKGLICVALDREMQGLTQDLYHWVGEGDTLEGALLLVPCQVAAVRWPNPATVAGVVVVAVAVAVGAIAVVHCPPTARHSPPGGVAAVATHATLEVVIVVVSVVSWSVVPSCAVVVALAAAPFSEGVSCPVVPEELPAWLPVVSPASTPPVEEGEVLHHIQMNVQLVIVGPFEAPGWVKVHLDEVAGDVNGLLLPVRISNG